MPPRTKDNDDVQTFLPWPGFEESAASLDRQRLGKQRVEAMQILNVLVSLDPSLEPPNDAAKQRRGWVNHPAVLMWRGYEHALATYGIAICLEWKSRGYKDGCLVRFREHLRLNPGEVVMPWWLGIEEFHESHRAMLIRKDPEHYGPQFPPSDVADYWWPTKQQERA